MAYDIISHSSGYRTMLTKRSNLYQRNGNPIEIDAINFGSELN